MSQYAFSQNKMQRGVYSPRRQVEPLIATLYKAWEQFQVPAVHYHYLLAVLATKTKHQQKQILAREITRLRRGNDSYHLIKPWIQTREAALQSIKSMITIFCSSKNPDQAAGLDDCQGDIEEQGGGFRLIFTTRKRESGPRDPIEQFIVALRSYQKATMEAIFQIYQWQRQTKKLGYQDLVLFMYHREDYFDRLQHDTQVIIQDYPFLFENNLFLLLQKNHKSSEFALVYQQLRPSPQTIANYLKALQIVENHQRQAQKQRILRALQQQSEPGFFRKASSLRNLFAKNRSLASVYVKKEWQQQKYKKENPKEYGKIRKNPENIELIQKWSSTIRLTESGFQSSKKPNSLKLLPINLASHPKEHNKKLPSLENEEQRLADIIDSKNKIQMSLNQHKLYFIYERGLQKNQIYNHLKTTVFRQSNSNLDVDNLTKLILHHKYHINLVSIKLGQLDVAWMAVSFPPKNASLRKRADIIALHQFVIIPNFQGQLESEFGKLGYGILTFLGKTIQLQNYRESLGFPLLEIAFKIGHLQESYLKRFIKNQEILKRSRVLKYYTYSQTSKYHEFCQHRPNECRVSFQVEQIYKINVNGVTYIRAKCDSIKKKGKVWQIEQKVNKLQLLLASSLEEVIEHSKMSDIDFQSSFEEQQESQRSKSYICIPEVRVAKRFIDERGCSVIVEHLKIGYSSPENSIMLTQSDLGNCLLIARPFAGGLVCRDQMIQGKTVALFSVD